jgi:endonuclease YncB( thermonuclease family)
MNRCLRTLVSAFGLAYFSYPVCAEDLYGTVVPSVRNLAPLIEGEAYAIDGGTIAIRLQPIRLNGIDALAHDQTCGDEWAGGVEATEFLSNLVAGQIVTCLIQGQDRYQHDVAICSVGNADLNEAMVLNGYARADKVYGEAYRRTEQVAKSLGVGYHQPGRLCVWRSSEDYLY